LLSVVGLVISWSRYDRRVLLFICLMSSYFILITGANGNVRFKLPSLLFYLCFAGIGFEYVFRSVTKLLEKARYDISI